jgi:Endonuclease/Exonuclease/phosphatase family
VKRPLIVTLAFFVVGSALSQSSGSAKIRITTWNLEWFPNGSPHETAPEKQAQRIAAAADVLRKLDPDILLLQEVRDYDACSRLAEAIHPGTYQVAICSAF